jgi:hypothetical protein
MTTCSRAAHDAPRRLSLLALSGAAGGNTLTATQQQEPHSLLSALGLEPDGVALLPSKERRALVAYLIRWGYDTEALDCLEAILHAHGPQVSVYDDMARVHLKMGEAQRAREIMCLRREVKDSHSSAVLEARAHLAAGDTMAAEAIARTLAQEAPDALLTWSLQVDVCLARGDLEERKRPWLGERPSSPKAARSPTAWPGCGWPGATAKRHCFGRARRCRGPTAMDTSRGRPAAPAGRAAPSAGAGGPGGGHRRRAARAPGERVGVGAPCPGRCSPLRGSHARVPCPPGPGARAHRRDG